MKTPIIPFFFLLMGIASCTHSPQPEDLIIPNPDVDSVIIADSLGNRNETPQKAVDVVNATNEKLSDTERFLLNPFDLYRFKQKVGQSNSGSGDKKGYFFKPQKKGWYCSFFLFHNLKCYRGKNKNRTFKNNHGLKITTYKPYGKYQEEYADPTEELIEVEAKINCIELPELAFVGLDTTEVIMQLGQKSFIQENCMVYAYDDRALILGLEGTRVKWLKYVHLNIPLTKDKKVDQLCKISTHFF